MARTPYIRHVRVRRPVKPNPFVPAGGVYDENQAQFGGQFPRLTARKVDVKKTINDVPWAFSPQSSWVHSYRYHFETKLLQIRFRNRKGVITANCEYAGIGKNMGYSIYTTGSKGKWVHRNVYTRPYVKRPF